MFEDVPIKFFKGSHRIKSPEETIEATEDKLRLAGITRLTEITHLDRIGIPVFSAIRPTAQEGSVSIYAGKGATVEQAKASAMMEGFERYSGEKQDIDKERMIIDSYENIENAINPKDLLLPKNLDSYNLNTTKLEWIEATDIISEKEIYIPANAVFHPYIPSRDKIPSPIALFKGNTNGLASGNIIEEAILHGIFEVIERDAWSIFEITKRNKKEINKEYEIFNPFYSNYKEVKEIYENKNTEIFIQSNTDLPFGLVIQYKNNKFCISSNPKKIMPEEIDSYNKLSEFQKTILTSYFFHYRDGYKVPPEKLIREIFKLIFSGTPYQIFPLYQKLYESQFSCIDFSKTTVGNEINKFQYKNDINKMIEELEKLFSPKHEEENYYMTLFSSFFELYSFHEEISDFFKYLDNEKLDETKTWNYINDIGEALVFFHNDFFNLFFKRFEGLDFMEFIPITDFIERIRNDKGNVSLLLLSNTNNSNTLNVFLICSDYFKFYL